MPPLPQFTFPLGGLLQMLMPGNCGILQRIVSTIVHILPHRVMDIANQPLVDGHSDKRREITLGCAVGRINRSGITELGHNVTLPNHQAVRVGPSIRHRPEQLTEHFLLIGKIHRLTRLLGFSKFNGRSE